VLASGKVLIKILLFTITFIIAIWLAQYWSKKMALRGVNYDYSLSKKAVEIGESTAFISTITNESRLFIPFIRMVEILPKIQMLTEGVVLEDDRVITGYSTHKSTIYLMARSQLHRHLEISFKHRGCHVFRGAILQGGNFIGLVGKHKKFEKIHTVVVYPSLIQTPYLTEILGGFLGDLSVRRFIMEDPILTIGMREYTGKEPLNQISWKHTARTSQMLGNHQLMVKQFDYTTEMVVIVFLDISSDSYLEPQQYETCFSLARTICQELEQRKIPFEFTTNAIIEGDYEKQSASTRITQNLGKNHLQRILEKLGRAGYGANQSYDAIVKSFEDCKEQNQSFIVIMPKRDIHKQKMARNLQTEPNGSLLFIHGEDFTEEEVV